MGHIPQNGWQFALNRFIKKYKKQKDVEAILLVGSYAAGNENEYSDIDVYIVINDNANYRIRGNKLVNGYLIEYFINPVKRIKKYLEEDKRGYGGSVANMFINGKVLYDKNNIVPDLIKEAKKYRKIRPPKDDLRYYACWDAYDEYKAAKYHDDLQYYICLQRLIEAYLYNHGYQIGPMIKIEKVFKDQEYRKKYNLVKFPHNKFNKLVIECFDNKNKDNLKNLYNYVMKNNFNINNYKHKEKL